MGKRIIISENEKENIQSLYESLKEQNFLPDEGKGKDVTPLTLHDLKDQEGQKLSEPVMVLPSPDDELRISVAGTIYMGKIK